ncbi:zinc finger protein 724-like [Procambarus clarkii]|uniref:zinc finger protein 724-like n=1 Tax=Procambarus clarkii TaxID=6728 RepID=UPI00374382E6
MCRLWATLNLHTSGGILDLCVGFNVTQPGMEEYSKAIRSFKCHTLTLYTEQTRLSMLGQPPLASIIFPQIIIRLNVGYGDLERLVDFMNHKEDECNVPFTEFFFALSKGSTVLRRPRAVHSGEKSEVSPKYGEGSTVLRRRRAVHSGEKSEVSPKYGEGSTVLRRRKAVHSGEKSEESPKYGEGSPLPKKRRAVRSGVKPTLCDRYPGEKSEVFPKSGQEFPLLKTVEQGRLGHTGEKLEACPESGERSTLLKKQMVADRPSCYQCGKTFSDRSGLNRHMLVHTGVKSHVFEECGKKFLRNDYLQQHLMAHSGDKHFLCKHCGKRFCRLGNLNDHMMGHNGTRPHMCHVCDKLFSRPDYLKDHMVVHMI